MNIHIISPYSNNHVQQTFVLPYPFRARFRSPLSSSHAYPQQGQWMLLWMHFCGGNSEGPPGGRPSTPTAPINTLSHGFNPLQSYCAAPSQCFSIKCLHPSPCFRVCLGSPTTLTRISQIYTTCTQDPGRGYDLGCSCPSTSLFSLEPLCSAPVAAQKSGPEPISLPSESHSHLIHLLLFISII